MDLRLLILVLILVILFIASGNNPFEMPEPGAQNSLFKKNLEEKMKAQPGIGGGFTGPMMQGTTGINPNNSYMPNTNYNTGAPLTAPGANPFATPYGTNTPNPGLAPQQPQQPAPFRNLPAPQSSINPTQEAPLAYTPPALKNGKPIFFSGPEVYTKDENGNYKPLPDGNYALKDGGNMWVMYGKQQVPKGFLTRKYINDEG